jgi:hypothetical protein
MNDLTKGKTKTLKEVADITKASYRTVAAYAQKAGWTENGKLTLLTEAQVTVILEAMKKPASSGTKYNLASQLQGVDTKKSRALRIDLLHRQIESEMQGEINELKAENITLQNNLRAAKHLLTERETGLEVIQRIAENRGLIMSDRDDVLATYGRHR